MNQCPKSDFVARFLLLLLTILIRNIEALDYCEKSCPYTTFTSMEKPRYLVTKYEEHFLCKHSCNDVKYPCNYNGHFHSSLISEDIQDYILKIHNLLRSKTAGGNTLSGKQISNMLMLQWDYELSYLAQCWLKQCKFSKALCTSSQNYPRVNQNFCEKLYSEKRKPLNLLVKQCLQDWTQQVHAFDADDRVVYDRNHLFLGDHTFKSPLIPHPYYDDYTQMIWSKTEVVGCAELSYYDSFINQSRFLFVCNYGPGGNVDNEKVYNYGPMCSRCPSNSNCSRKVRGLCEQSERKYYDSKYDNIQGGFFVKKRYRDLPVDRASDGTEGQKLGVSLLLMTAFVILCF